MALVDLQRSVVELCCSATADSRIASQLGDERIWGLYRDMVRKRLLGELKIALKRTHRAVGAQAFAQAFDAHMREDPPRMRFFHGLVGCFARSAEPFFRSRSDLPAHAVDLLRYEAAVWEVADLPDAVPGDLRELDFESEVLLVPALRLLVLDHAVHLKSHPDEAAQRPDPPKQVHLCIYRTADQKKARTLRLNPVTFDLTSLLAQGHETVSGAVKRVAEARKLAVDQRFIDGLCTVLADFVERGIILGCR